jgi:hypothetical protein
VCPSCNRLADPAWPLCAYCGHEFQQAPPARTAPQPAEWGASARVAEVPADRPSEPGGLRHPAGG